MASYSANYDAKNDALAVADIHHARLLLTEGAPLDFQKLAQNTVISNEQCEALKVFIRECKLDVDKYYFLHLALLSGQEHIAKLLAGSGADVNACWEFRSEKDTGIALQKYVDMLRKIYPGSCEIRVASFRFGRSTSCSEDNIMRFSLQSCTVVNSDSEMRKYGQSGSHITVNTRDVGKVKLRMDHGAYIEARTNQYETPLTSACGNPSVSPDCVQVLLEKGANPNLRSGYGLDFSKGAFHCAVERGNIETLQLLIRYGAQLEVRTSEGDTALSLACKKSVPADCVRILLENGAFPNVKNKKLEMPLTLATTTNHEEKIRLLKQYGATEEERSDQEETDLMSACQRNADVETVRHFMEKNVPPNLRNQEGETALHYAVLASDIQKLQVLIQHNSDVNAMDDNGVTPLMKACKMKACTMTASMKNYEEVLAGVECVKFLLENNALPNLTDTTGTTAVHHAARTGNKHNLQLLVQYGADVNALTEDSETPLMWASAKNYVMVDCVKFLLENNALVNLKNVFGFTALEFAIRKKDMQKVKVLLEYNADVNAMMDDGKAHLMNACFSDDVDRSCVKFLIGNSALTSLTIRGDPCLPWAVRNHQISRGSAAVQWLVDRGMCVNQRDKDGWTPLMAAVKEEHPEIVRVLIEAGADVHALRTSRDDSSMNGTTALSLAFGKTVSNFSCAELLIRAGAVESLPEKHNNLLHLMVTFNDCKMINLLLRHGMAPTLCCVPYFYADRNIPISPLTLALKLRAFPIIRYLTDNMALCPSDVNGHLYHSQLRGHLNRYRRNRIDVIPFMDEFYSQPKSLFHLCCVTISDSVGGVPGRLDRIKSLPLPEPLKKQLSFQNSYICLNQIC